MWDSEQKPDIWCNSVLIQLYKGCGSCNDLNNQRNIHTKQDIPKFFGHIVTTAAKPSMVNNMSPYQIGTKPGHRAQEHLYVIKSVIGLYENNRKAIALQLWDISKYFDRESLPDALNELYRSNVQGKLYKLIHEMNKDTRITVRTPVGDSEAREIGEGLGQGTIEGALCSAVNLDKGVTDFFSDSEYEVSYGDIVLRPALFQDDVSRFCEDPISAQMGNDRMEALAETKLLDYNMDKTCYIVTGKEKERKKVEEDFNSNPPTLYGQKMKSSIDEKYLGDQINCGGLAASVASTIEKRSGKVLHSIYEIRAIIDDCRIHAAGGLTAGLDISEMAVVPYLLNNCDTWISISEESIQSLDNLQNQFYRVLLKVPIGCPIPALYWELGGLLMKNRILKKKLLLLHHLANLETSSFAYQIYNVETHLQLPGLASECRPFLAKLGITNLRSFSDFQWKKLINDKINEINKVDLLSQMKTKKKMDEKTLAEEKFELKPYFTELNVSQARLKFQIRSSMVKSVKMNFSSDPKYSHELWKCPHCDFVDTQWHIISTCPAYKHLRVNKNFENDKDLVKFFQEVITMREAPDN